MAKYIVIADSEDSYDPAWSFAACDDEQAIGLARNWLDHMSGALYKKEVGGWYNRIVNFDSQGGEA